jgi:hypothetical protein
MKEGGLHVPAQSRRRRSTPSRSVDDLPASHRDSNGLAHRDTTCGSLKNQHTRQQCLALSLSLELVLALTLLKLVLNLRI